MMASQNTTQVVTANVVANDTFELAQRQITNQRKLMQMTQQQFNQMNLGGNMGRIDVPAKNWGGGYRL